MEKRHHLDKNQDHHDLQTKDNFHCHHIENKDVNHHHIDHKNINHNKDLHQSSWSSSWSFSPSFDDDKRL
ncbi:hypothetical protein [Mycoplasma miroungirhinis]|uniref:Uncharacterized protein n=1 Tax=Mycoplasma miroungirhinis TaxID=754516 RepID=A0A6M4JB09_9MOLU|nr:hypothetical protein [Mycoplasma miroungirhinis]QJR44174.1 hypothetical protein HLA92_01875 [Mycoplasma miroungirhinis]